jgi:hypothetical protein
MNEVLVALTIALVAIIAGLILFALLVGAWLGFLAASGL